MVQYTRIQQLGLFLATAGASLLLSGAAHAEGNVTSTSQTNQSTSIQEVVVTSQTVTTSSSKEIQKVSGEETISDSGTTPPAPQSPAASGETAQAPSAESSTPSTPSGGTSDTPAATGAQPAGSGAVTPVPVPVMFFQPVTIITPLVPQMVSNAAGTEVVSMPDIQPAKPALPELPAPTGALSHVTGILGQITMPLAVFGGFAPIHRGLPIPSAPLGMMLAVTAFVTFASLLRRWGYAISARGSDPRTQLVYEFASPAMSELVPVWTKYPG